MSEMTNRRSSSSSRPVAAKRQAVAAARENTAAAKAPTGAAAGEQAKKRVALGNITNQANNGGRNAKGRPMGAKESNANAATLASTVKKGPLASIGDSSLHQNSEVEFTAVNSSSIISSSNCLLPPNNRPATTLTASLVPCSSIKSPSHSGDFVSLDETFSTCDSVKSSDIEYIDNEDSSACGSLERGSYSNLSISENAGAAESEWMRDVPSTMEIGDIIDVDINHENPQFCTTPSSDIYRHLRIAETRKRPSIDFMETIQKNINASMRSILIDWLVEVAEEYRLVPDTLYLTVNYIDWYLSGNEMSCRQLQLLGVACMLIAAKYEEICAPQVEEFCYITDNTYFKEEVLQMEASVLKYLKFEMTAPTTKCFLRRFLRAAQGCMEVPALQLEFLANYVAELSLLEYSLLCFSPSLIAASAIFLAMFMLQPTKRPWNTTLRHYTLYKPSDLSDCVRALHHQLHNSPGSSLPAIREKYSQHKYKFVAKKCCPPSIPQGYFQDAANQ